jgi:hypothetical protein
MICLKIPGIRLFSSGKKNLFPHFFDLKISLIPPFVRRGGIPPNVVRTFSRVKGKGPRGKAK